MGIDIGLAAVLLDCTYSTATGEWISLQPENMQLTLELEHTTVCIFIFCADTIGGLD